MHHLDASPPGTAYCQERVEKNNENVKARSIQTVYCGLAAAMREDIDKVGSALLKPNAAATPFGRHAAPNSILVDLAKTYPTPAALRDFFVANPEEFNRILHNARPDALEIQDIVQFYFVLLDRIMKYITETESDPMNDD